MHEELLASNRTLEDIRQTLGADAGVYQSLQALMDLYRDLPCCYACFNSDDPTGGASAVLQDIS